MFGKHKLFKTLLLTALAAVILSPAEAKADTAEYYIRSAQDMLSIADDPYGKYVLCADIDMAGVDWEPLEFYGTLDGCGHSIVNLSISRLSRTCELTFDGNMVRYDDTHFSALFSIANNAEIRDLALLGVNVDISAACDCYCAMIAGYAVDTTIENCTVDGTVQLAGSGSSMGVGGLVGFGDVDVIGCSVAAELVFLDRNAKDDRCEMFLGGILADGLCDMSYNDVNIQGYISTHGYVHSGGLIGMSFRMHFDYVEHTIDHNKVTGAIHFFENNRNRRAYCDAILGEDLFHWAPRIDNDVDGFVRDETFDYSTELLPEMCAAPVYNTAVVEPDCSSCGYTVHTCTVCGYEKRDTYTLPRHVPGDAAVTVEPTYDSEGEGVICCESCGAELEKVVLDKLTRTERIELSAYSLRLHPGDVEYLTASVYPESAGSSSLSWNSSDETVAAVDKNGSVRAAGRGKAVITCTSDDGSVLSECAVSVKMSVRQFIRRYILFGWLNKIGSEKAPEQTAEPTEAPSAAPDEAAATPEPTVEPTPEVSAPPEFDYEAQQVTLFSGDYAGLTDGTLYWMQSIEQDTAVKLTSDTQFSRFYVMWHKMPEEWYVSTDGETWDAVENDIFLHQCYELDEPTTQLFIKVPESSEICEIYAFTDGNYPDWVQQWSLMKGAADILMFPTHADDEWCFFSGVVPYYAAEMGYKVQVVYMINHVYEDGMYRVHELLNGLWYAGEKYYPEINYSADDRMFDTYSQAAEFYGEDNFIAFQTEMIRKYQPTVVLGHDFDGEYGHSAHKLNAQCLAKAVEAAADDAQYADNAEKFGTWDTPKYYVHLYGDEASWTFIDAFDEPLEQFGGKTAMEVAVMALKYHQTQLNYSYVRQLGKQDSHVWGLYRSTVGEDALKNDFFENTAKDAANEKN